MKKSYYLAKAAYQRGQYKLVHKIAQRTTFDLEYENWQGVRRTITVDPSTYWKTKTEASVEATSIPGKFGHAHRRITIIESRIRNLQAFKAAIQTAARPTALMTPQQRQQHHAQQTAARRQQRQQAIQHAISQPPPSGITRFEYRSTHSGTIIIDLETSSINSVGGMTTGAGHPTGRNFRLDNSRIIKVTAGTGSSSTKSISKMPSPSTSATCNHEWEDAGTNRAWCKHCPAIGDYDMGKVVNIRDKMPKSSMLKYRKKVRR